VRRVEAELRRPPPQGEAGLAHLLIPLVFLEALPEALLDGAHLALEEASEGIDQLSILVGDREVHGAAIMTLRLRFRRCCARG
jgi:hypothetical protein